MRLKSRLKIIKKKNYPHPHFQGCNCYWTNKYNLYIFFYIYLVENPLQAMTALSLELMDITRECVSSFVMLCQAFTATDFSCCLFVGLSAFSFVFRKWNKCSIRLKSGDWLGHYSTFLPSNSCFCCMFWVYFETHWFYEAPPICCIWLNLGREYILIHFRIHPSASVLCHVFSKHQ